jgi:hypothetical protein
MPAPVALDDFDPVGRIHEHDLRNVPFDLTIVHRGVGRDDHLMADLDEPGRGAVDAAGARSARALDEVGGKTAGVVHVVDVDPLERDHSAGVHQVPVQRQAPIVLETRPVTVRWILARSISRVMSGSFREVAPSREVSASHTRAV